MPVGPVFGGVESTGFLQPLPVVFWTKSFICTAVERFLLGRVAVVLVAGQRFRGTEPFGVVLVRVVVEQAVAQAVDGGRASERMELGLARGFVALG